MGLSRMREFFEAGGVVMWPLLICSILSVAFAAERTIFWWKIYNRQQRVARAVLNLYNLNNVVDAIEKLRKNIDLPIARIFLFTLELENPTPEEFRLALETEAKVEISLLKRFNHIFDTIVGLAPLLGLQGTIFGLMKTFASLNIGNLAATNKAGLTAGISEDLIATAFGLLVGIMTLTFASIFRGLYQGEIERIEEYGGHLELSYLRRFQPTEKSYELTQRT
ncbi:MAG TPA: MotA/TolQ/ExbB proton channel family protein [Nodularia sp. (in: cyanobacteria)]|nr:MotA/TolQ/ExbB proton channel family protein [Nodularia sp. (in: cyanobacteria)]